MEDVLVPLFFFGAVFGFPLARRAMIHRHRLELLRAQPLPPAGQAGGPPEDAPALALRLPEPHRLYALALLCRLQDASTAQDPQLRALLGQIRREYLPDTLRAYLSLTSAAREQLRAGGRDPEGLLREQLEHLNRGVDDALRQDHAAADRLLTQSHYLRDRFATGAALQNSR
ncbi:hypothetical protein [Deinococcus depolymerans]|uniref:Uncharacterized protein n=1 Tax=Deinococcus depolymerans TaxID=392408 RepID=A0ABP3MLW6_9DEIO